MPAAIIASQQSWQHHQWPTSRDQLRRSHCRDSARANGPRFSVILGWHPCSSSVALAAGHFAPPGGSRAGRDSCLPLAPMPDDPAVSDEHGVFGIDLSDECWSAKFLGQYHQGMVGTE